MTGGPTYFWENKNFSQLVIITSFTCINIGIKNVSNIIRSTVIVIYFYQCAFNMRQRE